MTDTPLTPALLAELVRLPAVLSVPGDALLGAAAARAPRGSALALSSALVYAGGMALNDYADRRVDALERPHRPLPSGRVSAAQVKAVATRLVGGGLLAARVLGGRAGGRTALALVGSVVAYDVAAKGGPRGSTVMAACRTLDVLLGASAGGVVGVLRALPSAAVVGAHTATVTGLSAQEADGAEAALLQATRRRVLVVAAAAPLLAVPHGRRAVALAAVGSAAYVAQCVPGLAAAEREGTAQASQRAVGAAVLGMVPLQAALLAATGSRWRAGAVLALLPVARRLARRRSAS